MTPRTLGAMAAAALALALVGLAVGIGLMEAQRSLATQARNQPFIRQHPVFPSEREAVEQAWGEPIPPHLLRIGGPDEWGWASIQRIQGSDPPRFVGEYRNFRVRYVGELEVVGDVPGDRLLEDFRMSHIDGTDLVMREEDGPPPRRWYLLRPLDPESVERSR